MSEFREYSFDAISRVWVSPAHRDITYSDGDVTEDKILTCLKQASDVSSMSEELQACITDWPTEYHLSSTRHNLLRTLDIGSEHRVLELGAGCGAITRYLGETGATVVAVEGSLRRATIAAERCRDLPNVSVYCDNIVDFSMGGMFDFVTLVGVLEYSPVFVPGGDPIARVLDRARQCLSATGTLVLAIENQVGLKYISGCVEDHVGVPYYGIHDLYGRGAPITFGRQELRRHLIAAGFAEQEYFYPFPDYKMPDVVLAEAALDRLDFDSTALLYRLVHKDNGNPRTRAFHINLVWPLLNRNALLGELANSFLILASAAPRKARDWLARSFASNRAAHFATETLFAERSGSITVSKRLLHPEMQPPANSHFQHHLPAPVPYSQGSLLAVELQRIMARGGGIDELAVWAAPWVALLRSETKDGMLGGSKVDCIPSNLIRDAAGKLVMIDEEWRSFNGVHLCWVLIRGLVNAIASSPVSPVLAKLTVAEIITRVLGQCGYEIGDTQLTLAVEMEDALQQVVAGSGWTGQSLRSTLASPLESAPFPQLYPDELKQLTSELVQAYAEISRVKATASWRITKPLRLIKNFPSILRKHWGNSRG